MAFTQYYGSLFGNNLEHRTPVNTVILNNGPRLTAAHHEILRFNFTQSDIKRVLDSIPNDKAHGMDGYSSLFFKASWPVLKVGVTRAINDFFSKGKMPKEINVTSITLVPKVFVPTTVGDFRLISCCFVLYKCISKLMCEKLNIVLPDIISHNQGNFVAGRSILHNVLVCQDIVKIYRKRKTQRTCLMKLDLRKGYDTVE